MERCGCGVETPAVEGPSHKYMLSTAGCWEAYGRLLALEYEDPARWATHRLTVDAYALQHPGVDGPQARNSVGIHLSRLALIVGRGWSQEQADRAMEQIRAKKFGFPWLTPPMAGAGMTVVDVLAAKSAVKHTELVEAWARSVWASWAVHRVAAEEWLTKIV
jgi:hypothetical protein